MTAKLAMNTKVVDLVTVLFRDEVTLMRLQARSIKRFVEPEAIGRIFLIVNELAPEGVYSALANDVLPEFGELIRRVEIIPFTRLMRPHVAVGGFRTGQALRLLASRIVAADNYVALDPKTHFIRSMNYGSFVDARSGKARAYKLRRLPNNSLEYDAAFSYFEASTPEFFLPIRAPFTFKTTIVREMLEAVETREGAHFDDFFTADPRNMPEFGLYQAWLAAQPGGLEASYRFGGRNTAGIFARTPSNAEGMEEVMASLGAEATQSFSLHRKRIASLADEEWHRITAAWVEAGLMANAQEAAAFESALKAGSAVTTG